MASWSKITEGSALDCVGNLQEPQNEELCFDYQPGSKGFVEVGEKQDKLTCSFNQFLSLFLKENSGTSCFRPLPPMLGNGTSVDLLKLYIVVRDKGGFETVSHNGLWNLVAEESWLGPNVGSSVKLIYFKYLSTLEKCLQGIGKDKDLTGGFGESGFDLGGFYMCLGSNIKGFLSKISEQKKKREEAFHELNFVDVQKVCNGVDAWSLVDSDVVDDKKASSAVIVDDGVDAQSFVDLTVVNDEMACEIDGKDVCIHSSSDKEDYCSRKRKRECYLPMLNWFIEVAKNPCASGLESLPERSKWKFYGSEQLWKQVILAREAIFLKRNSTAEQLFGQNQKVQPSIYDDHSGSKRLRCSQRLLYAKESPESSSVTQSDSEDYSGSLTPDSVVGSWSNNHRRKRVPVGKYFQATVPEWAGEAEESDSKWLGTQVWPLEKGERNKYFIERNPIGKGRENSCGCQYSGSHECIRFHVAEKRMKVKLELGSAFYHWKFDKMGEQVALSWTKDEEKEFQAIVRSNPLSLDKCFWVEMFKIFGHKSRKELVSYYFNVFILQHRGYQNRTVTSNIDSDDDESVFASSSSITKGVDREAIKSPGAILCCPKKAHLKLRQYSVVDFFP